MTGEVDEDSVTLLDDRVIDEVIHEFVFNSALRGLGVGEKANMLSGNVQVVHEPASDRQCVIYTGLVVPDVAALIFVDA